MVKPVLAVVLACLLLGLGTACASSGNGGGAETDHGSSSIQSPGQVEQESGEAAISWREAGQHEGESVTVEGPVAGTLYANTSNGEPTFLNVGKDYPDPHRLAVVIWGDDRSAFPEPPEDMYSGATIRVTGTIDSYEGVPQIEVGSPADIEVVN